MRVRVTVAATVVAIVGTAIGSTLFVLSVRHSLRQSLVASAQQQASAVVAQLDAGRAPDKALVGTIDDVTTQIVGSDRSLVASDRARPDRPLRTTPGVSTGVRPRGLHDSYVVVARRASQGRLVVVGTSDEDLQRATATTVGLLVIAVPLGVAALAFVIWLSVGRALRPVEGMRRQATSITSDHLHRRLPVPRGDDEISRLARTLNEMLDGIDSAQSLQRQFVSDASHELRSPLASMRQLTEVADRFPDSMTTRELAREIRAEEGRMEDMVTALLTLARLDDSAQVGNLSVVDLDELVIQEVARFRELTPPKTIATPKLNAAQVRGNPILLTQLVRNLLSNAVRHARARVAVCLDADDRVVTLLVDDDGAGIRPEDRERVFERFVRLDEARHRDAGGSGLGLAIVRKVTDAVGGRVFVEDAPEGGARLHLELPSAPG